MRGRMNYIDLLTFTLYITTFVTPVRKLATLAEIFTNGLAGLRRFAEVMRIEPSIREPEDALPLTDVKGEIVLDHVSFGYQKDTDVPHDISLTVCAGETLAVVGHSGGGKSTLCQLIPRFYDVESGERLPSMDMISARSQRTRRAPISALCEGCVPVRGYHLRKHPLWQTGRVV